MAEGSAHPETPTEGSADLVAWIIALDSLEAALDDVIGAGASADDVERIVASTGWVPPELGPLPTALLERAQLLARRQQDAVASMISELGALRRHRSALGTVHSATAPRQSAVYLNVTG